MCAIFSKLDKSRRCALFHGNIQFLIGLTCTICRVEMIAEDSFSEAESPPRATYVYRIFAILSEYDPSVYPLVRRF